MAITLVFYVSVSLLMSLLMNRYNARAQIKE
jgi:ABC-type amino acid transport system permease subunit